MRTLPGPMAVLPAVDSDPAEGGRDWVALLPSLETGIGIAVLLLLWAVLTLTARASRPERRSAAPPRRRMEVVVLDLDGLTDEQLARLVALRRQYRQRTVTNPRGTDPVHYVQGVRGWCWEIWTGGTAHCTRLLTRHRHGAVWTVAAGGLVVLSLAAELVWGVSVSPLALLAAVPLTLHWGWRAGVTAAGASAGAVLVIVTEPRWSLAVADPWAVVRIGLMLAGMLLLIGLLHRRGAAGTGRQLRRQSL